MGNSNDTLTTAGKNPNIPGIVDIVGNSNNLTLTTAGKRGVGGAAMFGSLLDVLNILLSPILSLLSALRFLVWWRLSIKHWYFKNVFFVVKVSTYLLVVSKYRFQNQFSKLPLVIATRVNVQLSES